MKMTRNWIMLIVIMIILSVYLFTTGRQHTLYIENGKKSDAVKSVEVSYSIDGNKVQKIKSTKKKMELVKGKNHIIVVEFKGENGEIKKLEKEFSLKMTENAEISLPLLINQKDNWINEVK